MGTDTLETRFELNAPPVRRVRMTLYFKEMDELRVSALSNFIEELRGAYPEIREQFPLASRPTEDSSPGVFVSSRTAMPFPLLSFANPESGQVVSFQSDRFSLAWNFGNESDDSHYPGYESLRDQLARLFKIFSEAVHGQLGEMPVANRSQCWYLNSVNELPGAGLALYLLTGQEDVTARAGLQSRTYAGARVRLNVESDGLVKRVSAGVDSPNDDETTLWIRVTSEAEATDPDALDLLDSAHDELIRNFVQFTPNWLRSKWGESK